MKNLNMRVCTALAAMLIGMFSAANTPAQTRSVPSRVAAKVDDTRTVTMKGNVHPLARAENDLGAMADSEPLTRMVMVLQRSPEQEVALKTLLEQQQTKGSAAYHAWLTPEQFGKQFGPSDSDLQAVTDWLTSHGFQISKVGAGRTTIEFDGNVAQVRSAFHTEMHRFNVEGEARFANVSDPQIPEALAPVVGGVVALNNFPRARRVKSKGLYRKDRTTGEMKPLYTYGDPANIAVGPGDFNVIYNVPAGADGTGTKIAVVGDSNIDPNDIIAFRHLFGLDQNYAANNVTVILNGADPGLNGDETEADLDVEYAGGIAPGAQIMFIVSPQTQSNPTQVTAGYDLSGLYAVDNNVAPVLSISFGTCEAYNLTAGNQFYSSLWQQAAAEGITVAIASGDTGSAGCDNSLTETAATFGIQASGNSSTPYNVSVGGTDFDPSATSAASAYWMASGTNTTSALKYVPETTWDNSTCAANYPAACTTVATTGDDLVGGGGAPSNCATATLSNGSVNCQAGVPIPPYQVGAGLGTVPAQFTTRMQPDVSFFASNGHNGVAYIVCEADANPSGAACSLSSPYTDFSLIGGTSASTPAFAGVMAMVNQKTGARQGNANVVLYGLAASDANYASGHCNSSVGNTPASGCVFNDVTKGNNSVACVAASTSDCSNQGSGFGVLIYNGGPAFTATTGYDLATGLGTINVTNLLNKWSTFARTATTTTVNTTSGLASGSTFTANVSVTPAGASGDVSLTALANDQTTILGSFGPFTLANGTVTASTNLIPPGTAYVSAYYGGDATHAASNSALKSVGGTVSGASYPTAVTLNFVTFDANGNPVLSTSSQTVTYGTSYILAINVNRTTGGACGVTVPATTPVVPCPTGTIALTDNGSALNDFPNGKTPNATNLAKLNNGGLVEDLPIQLGGGSHSVQAQFTTADTNYSNTSSNTLSITIKQATTSTTVSGVPSGTQVALTAVVASQSNSSQGPTGSVTFTNGSTSLGSATCTPTGANSNTGTGAFCTATLTATISALTPPGVRDTRRMPPMWPILAALASLLLFGLGWRWMPEQRRRAYAYAGLLMFAAVAAGLAGCGGGSSSGGGGKTVSITAAYAGDTNYSSSSGSVSVTVQ